MAHLGVGVLHQLAAEERHEAVVVAHGGSQVVQLQHAHHRVAAHVAAGVGQPGHEGGDEVLHEVAHAQRGEGAEGQASDHGVVVLEGGEEGGREGGREEEERQEEEDRGVEEGRGEGRQEEGKEEVIG